MDRMSSHQRGYGSRWQKCRSAYLYNNPLCLNCQKIGRLTAATEVDHIIPHKGNQELFWDIKNWQPICKSCHSKKTAMEDGAFGNKQGQAKVQSSCGIDGIPNDRKHHWNR